MTDHVQDEIQTGTVKYGQHTFDTHPSNAHTGPDAQKENGHSNDETQLVTAQPRNETQQNIGHRNTQKHIAEIREIWRQRVCLHKAEKSLTLQVKALARRLVGGPIKDADALYKASLNGGGGKLTPEFLVMAEPFLEARKVIEAKRKLHEKRLAVLARELPVWDWIKETRGVSELSFASMIGECGDISNYATVSRLWKRFGLAVIDGERQRKIAGAKALKHGYSPRRRSVMWNVGACLIRAKNTHYKAIYDARKKVERPNVDSNGHAHNRAKRYMEKRFLADLWSEWND